MMYIVSLLLVVAAASAIKPDDPRRLAYQNPDLFEGDILGIDPNDRNVIPQAHMRWTNNRVPYLIHSSLANYAGLIQSAIDEYHRYTCLRFVPRSTESNYIMLFKGQGCYSYVGMVNAGQQPLSLGDGCHYKGTVIHELGHAIGFYHEQNRSDRDQYLTIYWNNIQSGMETQFALLKPHENLLITPFDFNSIMIYGNYAFSRDGRSVTMVAKTGQRLTEPYDKGGMAQSDIARVRRMYNC